MRNTMRILVGLTALVTVAGTALGQGLDWITLRLENCATGSLTSVVTSSVPVKGEIESFRVWSSIGTNLPPATAYTNTLTIATVDNGTAPAVTLLSYNNDQSYNVYPAVQENALGGTNVVASYRRHAIPGQKLTLTATGSNVTNGNVNVLVIFRNQ